MEKEKADYTLKEWHAEAARRFGRVSKDWKFVCPVCEYPQSLRDFLDLGVDMERAQRSVGFSCIGRKIKDSKSALYGKLKKGEGPCDYAGGGLLRLNPVKVELPDGEIHSVFAFFEPEET